VRCPGRLVVVFTTEFLNTTGVRTWRLTPDGAEPTVDRSYRPRFYVRADHHHHLTDIESYLREHPLAVEVAHVRRRPGWRHGYEEVLRISVESLSAIDELAHQVSQYGRPGGYQCYNVDFSREFRYALESGRNPTPSRDLDVLRVRAPREQVAGVDPLRRVDTGETTFEGQPAVVATDVASRIRQRNPDVLRVSSADLIPRLFEAAPTGDDEYALGRKPGYTKRASESTYESYGRVGHSPARYSIPGRVILDESNSFFLSEAGLPGIVDLVERSGKPLQEAAWASIGNILTAIQIQYAAERDVLVPWRSWRTERFKTASQLDAADRGGYTFEPDVGVHETVHELDFSSLYPNIIREYNISPETIRCDCHPNREDVPGLGYSICPDDGYLPEVLGPIIDDRAEIKTEVASADDPERVEELEARSAALKWILVSCFGYQGFSNAKFGRIEAHEAINAFAREILLDAKAAFEAAGYRVVHGIIDSIWVQSRDGVEQEPVDAVAQDISEATGIELEHEGVYDWVAFCPTADGRDGALTKYFGRRADGEWKYRGIECRQRSTPTWIADRQREFIDVFDETRSTEAVVASVRDAVEKLRAGGVDPTELAIRNRVTKTPAEYGHETRNVAALRRADDELGGIAPGEDVEYVVVDDAKSSRDRVELVSENPETYDERFYVHQLIRAAAGVLGPFGWQEDELKEVVRPGKQQSLG
jgi:DNA polymerase I